MAVNLTSDVKALCRSMPRGTAAPTAAAAAPPPYVPAFTAACADVAVDARKARSNLAQLETLVQGASIFSDPAEKIAHLVSAASDRLGRAAAALANTRRRHLDAARPRPGTEGPLAYRHCAAIEAALAADLDRISRDLRSATRSRAETVKKHAERRELFGKSADREAAPRARAPVFDALPRPGDTTSGSGGVSGFQQQQLLIPDQYVTQRADAAQRVEAQVHEVTQIFGRVADLIRDQGESIERIEINVESAAADVEAAEGELTERLDSMGSTVITGLKVGGIVLATLVFYVILV